MYLKVLDRDEDGDLEFKFKERYGSWYGKPSFPEDTDSYDISDYLGPDSLGFFITLGLDLDFLEESADTWENSDSYKDAKAAVKSLYVVNDAAERGVKISADFIDSARLEQRYQTILQVAENDRNIVPNQRKRHIRVIK